GWAEMPLDQRRVNRGTAVVLGDSGLAALDCHDRDRPSSDRETAIPLAARSFGSGSKEAERLVDLVRDWSAAGRPPASRLHIAAYPAEHPATRPPDIVEPTP